MSSAVSQSTPNENLASPSEFIPSEAEGLRTSSVELFGRTPLLWHMEIKMASNPYQNRIKKERKRSRGGQFLVYPLDACKKEQWIGRIKKTACRG